MGRGKHTGGAEIERAPELLVRGTVALYGTPAGGIVVAFRQEGQDQDQHMEIPARYLKMMSAAFGGRNPLGMLTGMLTGSGPGTGG